MDDIRNCPECNEEVSMLAKRCKSCGARLPEGTDEPSNSEVAPDPEEISSVLEVPEETAANSSTSESESEIALDPDESSSVVELSAVEAQESSGSGAEKEKQEQPPTPEPAAPEVRPSAPPPPPPRAQAPGRKLSRSPTSLAPPPPTPSTPPPPTPSTPPPARDSSSLPKPKAVKQEVVDLTTDSKVSEMLDLHLDDDESESEGVDDIAGRSKDAFVKDAASGTGLARNLFTEKKLKSFRRQGMPPGMVKSLSALKVLHLIAGGAGSIVIIVSVAIFSSLPKETVQETASRTQETVVEQQPAQESQKPPEEPATATKPAPEAKDKEEPAPVETAKPSMPAAEEPTVPLPTVPGACKPLGSYPDFLWKDQLDALVKAVGKAGVCHLFGVSPSVAVSAYRGSAYSDLSGYDLIKGGGLLQVFPGGKADRAEPTMDLLFLGDKLFEIRLNYGQASSAKDLPKALEQILGKPFETGKDHLKRRFKRYVDGDLVVEYLEKKDRYRRVFREIVFASQVIRAAIIGEENQRRQAEAAYENGIDERNQRNFDKAIESFNKARMLAPRMGMAYIWEAWIQLHSENFATVGDLAEKTLEVSRDVRARAEAEGLLAVTSLFAGDKNKALSHFKAAAEMDPAKPSFKESITELETGYYRPTRVAMTAARIKCKDKVQGWSMDGILARGNFPDQQAYLKALTEAKADPLYKNEFKRWEQWECR